MAFTSCKSSESAYKQAYLKAKAQDEAQQRQQEQTVVQEVQQSQQPVVTPLEERSTAQTRVVDNADNIRVRQETVSVVSGSGLKAFSVVVGSFGLATNAEGLQQRLRDAGYDAQIVKNEDRNMYRVIAATFDNKADAARSRDQLRATYADAWLLSNQ